MKKKNHRSDSKKESTRPMHWHSTN